MWRSGNNRKVQGKLKRDFSSGSPRRIVYINSIIIIENELQETVTGIYEFIMNRVGTILNKLCCALRIRCKNSL